ncbi:DMT family transporter [Actinospica robiniae]|uniref:DMT family transporter n=1 Tax=Actinospica robiniae TaxID=304901 RepID=UPI00042885BD|nr:EamA family transporter [Actinospica robiniae]
MPNDTSLIPHDPVTTIPAAARARAGLNSAFAGPAPILIAAVLWGTTGTTSSLAPSAAPPAAIGCAGLVLGGLLLFLTSPGARPLPAACTRAERGLLAMGAIAVAGYPVSFYPAVHRIGVAVATVIALGSAPVFTGLLAWIIDKSRPNGRWAAATTAAAVGCVLLALGPGHGHGHGHGHGTSVDAAGIAMAACAGLSYAAYSFIGARLVGRSHASASVFGVMFGAAALLVAPLVLGSDPRWLATVRGSLVTLHLAVFTVYVAYRLFGHGLRHTTAATATTLTLAEPAVAAVLGVTVLSERLPAVSWVGLAILGAGLAILTVRSAEKTRKR